MSEGEFKGKVEGDKMGKFCTSVGGSTKLGNKLGRGTRVSLEQRMLL